jgi:hypothetical protein
VALLAIGLCIDFFASMLDLAAATQYPAQRLPSAEVRW